MALINCPECGKEISDQVEKCIHCGYPLKDNSIDKKLKPKKTHKPIDKRKVKRTLIVAGSIVLFALLVTLVYFTNFTPNAKYAKAEKAYQKGKYKKAVNLYSSLGDYKDAPSKLSSAEMRYSYFQGKELYEKEQWAEARSFFSQCLPYEDARDLVTNCDLNIASEYMDVGKYFEAEEVLKNTVQFANVKEKWRECEYNVGLIEQESGNLIEASKKYNNSSKYLDADEKVKQIAEEFIKIEDFNSALEAFGGINSNIYKDYQPFQYVKGKVLLQSDKYIEALDAFQLAGNYLDAADSYDSAAYSYACNLFKEKDYDAASEYLKQIPGYLDADEMLQGCQLMRVKDLIDEGCLHEAKNLADSLDDGLVYKDYSTSGFKDLFKKNAKWVELCGIWTSTSGQMRVTQSGGYYSYWWYYDFKEGDRKIDVKCILQGDDKVKIICDGEIDYYTEYGSISELVEKERNPFHIEEKMSGLGTVSIDNYTTITFSDNKISVNYKKVDKSKDVYFTYTYKTDVTYGKRTRDY